MLPGLLQAALMDSSQLFVFLLRKFAKCQGLHDVDKAGHRGCEGRRVADFDMVGIVEEEKDG